MAKIIRDEYDILMFFCAAQILSSAQAEMTNVMDYGAQGDGVSNDSDEIDAAINYIVSIGGGTVFFPAGIYIVSRDVPLFTGVEIKGAGRSLTTIKMAVGAGGNIIGGVNATDVKICDLTVDGGANPTYGHGIRFGNVRNALIERVNVLNAYEYGIGLQSGTLQNIVIQDVVINGQGRDGIDIKDKEYANENIVLRNIRVIGAVTGESGVDIRGKVNLENIYVYMPNAGAVGITFRYEPKGSANGRSADGSTLSSFVVEGIDKNNNTTGVLAYARNLNISNGQISNVYYGLYVTGNDANGSNTNISSVNMNNVRSAYIINTPKVIVSGSYVDSCTYGVDVNVTSGPAFVDLVNITATHTYYQAFNVQDNNNTVGYGSDGVRLINCKALYGSTWGFRIVADNVLMDGCSAIGHPAQGLKIMNTGGNIAQNTRVINCEFSKNSPNISNGGSNTVYNNNIEY